jgi:hypothetical protein
MKLYNRYLISRTIKAEVRCAYAIFKAAKMVISTCYLTSFYCRKPDSLEPLTWGSQESKTFFTIILVN